MQQQAAAAARDMQRRATLPMPPRQRQEARGPRQEESRPAYRQPEPLHHRSPSQQARQYASYGRMQPQLRRQEWQQPASRQAAGERQQGRGQPRQHQAKPPPRHQEPPPPPPPPPAAASMPPLADLLGMLGGLGGFGGAAQKKENPESVFGAFAPQEGGEGGMDSILMLLLLFLLQKESADQGLLLALMYIMM